MRYRQMTKTVLFLYYQRTKMSRLKCVRRGDRAGEYLEMFKGTFFLIHGCRIRPVAPGSISGLIMYHGTDTETQGRTWLRRNA
jgi:hypothetical protein